jgi:nitrous oxidase accessory protein NosD
MKRPLLLFTLLLFLAAGAQAQTLYVDGVGDELESFKTIQEAIDFAKENTVIEVAAGTYTETIYINKVGLTLKNKAGDTPVINGEPDEIGKPIVFHVVSIYADNITLQGFKIINGMGSGLVPKDQGPAPYEVAGVFLTFDAVNCLNRYNTITQNQYGIIIGGGGFGKNGGNPPIIIENNIFNNQELGLLIDTPTKEIDAIDATCNWWGTTENIQDEIEGPANWLPFWVAEDGPCLQKMFKMEVNGRQSYID